MTLPWTGERYLPEVRGQIELEHIHRYVMARELAVGKTVLDIASGEGYGSAMIAEVARNVVGVDLSEEAVTHAQKKYRKDNLRFKVGSCASIPMADASVDLVTSFETIEHHDEHELMLAEIKRVLRPNGQLIISSPEKHEYSIISGQKNEFHVKELYRVEFEKLLESHFKNLLFYGQRIVYGSGIFLEGQSSKFTTYTEDDNRSRTKGLARPTYLIAIASDARNVSAPSGIYEQNLGQCEAIIERNNEIVRLNQAIVERDGHYAGLRRKATEVEDQLSNLNDVLVQRDEHISSLNQKYVERDSEFASIKQGLVDGDIKIVGLNRELAASEAQIILLTQASAERDRKVVDLTKMVAIGDKHVVALNEKTAELERSVTILTNQLEGEQKAHRQSQLDGAARENVLLAKANEALQSSEKMLRDQTLFGQEVANDRENLMAQAEQAKVLLARNYEEHEKRLNQIHAEKERTLILQLDAERKMSRQQDQALHQIERMLKDEMSGLQIQLKEQKHINQLTAHQYNYELNAAKVERNLALEARNNIGNRFFAEQQESHQLRQKLAESHQYFTKAQSSLLWRFLMPLRKLSVLGALPANLLSSDTFSVRYEGSLSRQAPNPLRTDQPDTIDENMPSERSSHSQRKVQALEVDEASNNIVTINETSSAFPMSAPSFEALIRLDDRQFIDAIYTTLLRREPDGDGLNFYLGAIHKGTSKLQILREIFFSQECRDNEVELPGLREALAQSEIHR
jgi:SAM-dependent methyltransferase